ncbi:thioredoxin family protein [Blastopirellula sp. J2-11]|uniref:thioredoxin family protein n=1 Tax=Blastopirellula sp. J2-11 TaxID=2943192 RepID=UPI0021C877C6|nr:thioredoxin family protein [Blastopirellula sp. J2-11]UUO08534.1 thioredoxin family protein [Blastopirellula sp. J2-11]
MEFGRALYDGDGRWADGTLARRVDECKAEITETPLRIGASPLRCPLWGPQRAAILNSKNCRMKNPMKMLFSAGRTALFAFGHPSAARGIAVALLLALLTSSSAAAEDQMQTSEAENSQPISSSPVHVDWISDITVAQELANKEGKDLILFFTGSDWCAFCIQMEEEVLAKPETAQRLSQRYVPVVLDFPHDSELSIYLTQQNQKLKSQLNIIGFPTIYFVDADLLPYGQMAGYKSPAEFWKSFDQISALGAELSAIKVGESVADIQDAQRLDRLFGKVPREMLEYGWLTQIQRMIDEPSEADSQIRQSWAKRLAQIVQENTKRDFLSAMSLGFRQRLKVKTSSADMLEYLDSFAVKADGNAKLLEAVNAFKAHYLFNIKRFKEAAAIADEMIAAESADPKTVAMMQALKQQIAASEESPAVEEKAEIAPILFPLRD